VVSADPVPTARLRLRRWHDRDRAPLSAMHADPRVMAHLHGTLSPAQSDALYDRFQVHFAERGFGFWAVEIPGVTDFAGFLGVAVPRFTAHFTPCVEIGWRLAAEHWGQGYATEGARAALDFAFTELSLAEVVAFTVPDNRRSRRVMEKLGMTHDPADDFEHPFLPIGDPLRPHVLYRLRAGQRS
jgi:RimJ/RimL family protein N-acetyltransferase